MNFDHYTDKDFEYEVLWVLDADTHSVVSACQCYVISRDSGEYVLKDDETNERKRYESFEEALHAVGMEMMLAEAKATACCVDSFMRHGRRKPKHLVDGNELVEFPW